MTNVLCVFIFSKSNTINIIIRDIYVYLYLFSISISCHMQFDDKYVTLIPNHLRFSTRQQSRSVGGPTMTQPFKTIIENWSTPLDHRIWMHFIMDTNNNRIAAPGVCPGAYMKDFKHI